MKPKRQKAFRCKKCSAKVTTMEQAQQKCPEGNGAQSHVLPIESIFVLPHGRDQR